MTNHNDEKLHEQPQEEHTLLELSTAGKNDNCPRAAQAIVCSKTATVTLTKTENNANNLDETKPSRLVSLHSHRFRICLLLMLALFIFVTIRVALSVSIVCMVDRRSTEITYNTNSSFTQTSSRPMTGSCTVNSDSDEIKARGPEESCAAEGSLQWTGAQQSLLLSANFYGSFASVAFAGTLAELLGAKRVLAVAISVSSLLTLASPFLARFSYVAYVVTRVIIGASEGFSIPALNLLASRWFPVTEKATVAAIYTSGIQLAAGFSSLAAANVCQSKLLGGWPAVFYISGAIGLVFVAAWLLIVSDHPETSRLASHAEKNYLAERVVRKQRPPSLYTMPWSALLCSPALHALLAWSFSFGLISALMQSYLPSFLADLGLPINRIGLYTLAPFISQVVSKLFAGPAMDAAAASGFLSLTTVTKIAQTIGSFGAAATVLLLAFVPNCERPFSAFVFLVAYGLLYAAGACAFFTSLLAIAPLYTGTLSSLNQLFTMIASILTSVMVTLLTSLEVENKWVYVFAFAALFHLISGAYYIFCGTAEVQPWADQIAAGKPFGDSSTVEERCKETEEAE